jgi:DNA uptake protein ComE-like DNA-binding protein
MMFRFNWSDLVFPELLQDLKVLAGGNSISEDLVTRQLGAIFRATGGLAIANSDWSQEHRIRVAKKLLHEATTALLRHRYHFQHPHPGVFYQRRGGVTSAEKIMRVDVNHAPASELAGLPVIGSVLANRIIEARRKKGYFTSWTDLAMKVHGLGEQGAKQLAGVLDFDTQGRPTNFQIAGTFEKDFGTLLSYNAHGKESLSLTATLEEIAVYAAHYPHPATRLSIKRDDLEFLVISDSVEPTYQLESVSIMADQDYYLAIVELLQSAKQKIDVCLFFMALGAATHPTRKLLDSLVEKAASGCQVRVLLDRDDQDDPYGSRLINARAASFLATQGVQVKFDSPGALLHSKFVLIDTTWVIVGSHNWTVGSFFDYRDLSMCLRGTPIVSAWRERFETLWMSGTGFNI